MEDSENEAEKSPATKVKSAKAVTDLMLGLMDFKIGKITYSLFEVINNISFIMESYLEWKRKSEEIQLTSLLFHLKIKRRVKWK